jgi:3-hydroxybutyryl-CoA dehydrogenase
MEINHVTVLGAGTMGAGIAQVSALVGCDTVLFDIADAPIEKGMAGVQKSLQKGVDRNKVTPEDRDGALSRITTSTDLAAAVASADLVIEAVPEVLELKRKIFKDVEAAAPAHAILATNTSSLPISDIAAGVDTPARMVGMHFFNPVPIMKLLEIVVGRETSDATRDAVVAFGERLSKEVITVKDAPGFASSRLGICIAMEAIRMVEQEVASPEDIDRAMVFGYGHPMGPLRLTDLVGLDVRMAIAEHLAEALDAPAFQPPAILKKLVAEGKLGRKSGHGFYSWKD